MTLAIDKRNEIQFATSAEAWPEGFEVDVVRVIFFPAWDFSPKKCGGWNVCAYANRNKSQARDLANLKAERN